MFAPRNSSPVAVYGKEEVAAYEIKLKKVLGLTVCSNAALDASPVSGLLAYPAGCTIVLFNAKRQTQAFLVNTSRKTFTSVAFSRCGRYIATGECGINPAIKVWELEAPNGNLDQTTGGNVVAEFVDHKYAVTCVAFSPTGKYLVSVGSQHDMIVNVFDWKSNLKMASNKISSKVSAVSFAEDGSYFVTVGNRHVKYWYLEGGRKYKDPVPLMGRSAILGDLRDNDFCAVSCGKGAGRESTFAITRQGHLVEFSSRRLLDKWVQCRTTSANCLCVNEQFIFVGCAEAIIRIFNAATLEYVTTLPRTHYLGVDVAQGIHINHIMSAPQNAKYPDCIAMVYDEQRSKVSCVYNDHSLYIWDMRDIRRVGKSHSFLYHSTCIWGVETVPYNIEREGSNTLPEDSFVTCSSDDTIRVWGLEGCANNEHFRKNIYSKDLLKVIYTDAELNFIKDQESFGDKGTVNSAYDGRNGVRCIKISPDLQHLACGDRSGNIRIYNLQNLKLITAIEAHESEVLCLEYSNEKIERQLLASASRDRLIHVFDVAQGYLLLQTLDDHSSSITSIKFVGSGLNFQMISCGADKSIMFRTFQGNIFLRGTHTSGKSPLYDMEVDSTSKHILTACQDRNVRVYGTQNAKHTKTFKGSHSDDGTLVKLSLDPSGIYVATSCTDRTLAVYDYYSNECMARMYGHSELVTGLKFTNDCRHLISASGDGCVFIWQIPHDMIVTMQARISQQRLRSGHPPLQRPMSAIVSPEAISVEPQLERPASNPRYSMSPTRFIEESPLTPNYRLSEVGQLPQWAKRKAAGNTEPPSGESGGIAIPNAAGPASAMQSASSITNLSSSPSQMSVGAISRARGRWAQRGQFDPDDIRSNSESPSGNSTSTVGGVSVTVGLGNTQTSDYNSASSKDIMYNQTYLSEDSSIDSGMDTRRDLKFAASSSTSVTITSSSTTNGTSVSSPPSAANRLMPDKRKASGIRFDTHSNEHDGDVEDISDGERTSSDHGMFYGNISPSTPTDFKVTAMNEDELRKSVRRQKFEKTGLALSNSSHTASTGTGTGTSDTEDEGSTPSAENADRSLASTLGGSSEDLRQTTSSFLQAALPDGPGLMLERGSSNRRSISAKHNTENGKSSVGPPTITKSYTSTKKEELLKVINEAKQKLENVGYRSLRGSHSISDLSLAGNLDGSRNVIPPNRYAKPVNNDEFSSPQYLNSPPASLNPLLTYQYQNQLTNPQLIPQHLQQQQQQQSYYVRCQNAQQQQQQQTQQRYYHYPQQQNFFNCAVPKSVLQQNCEAMRQVQQHYPPYPHHVGVHQIHPPPGVPFLTPNNATTTKSSTEQRPFLCSTLPAKATAKSVVEVNRVRRNPGGNVRRTPSILKHYKSCPVSPVHEEDEFCVDNKTVVSAEPKRHSVYADDARTILDMIHVDTEKMIEEITKKYGDLDDIDVNIYESEMSGRIVSAASMPNSLSQPCFSGGTTPPTPEIREICTPPSTGAFSPSPLHMQPAPKRALSEYLVYEKVYCKRKVSLSDILNENPEQIAEARRAAEARFLETQRHSSASFFLGSQQFYGDRSQESLLSSEEFPDGGSYCNSLESILSDESDSKSAPLDLAQQQMLTRNAGIRNFIIHGPITGEQGPNQAQPFTSKSYGSSPNSYNSFDYFMQQRRQAQPMKSLPSENPNALVNYTYDLQPTQRVSTAAPTTYPERTDTTTRCLKGNKTDDIPTSSTKNRQYNYGVSKSLSSDFAHQRQQQLRRPWQTGGVASQQAAKSTTNDDVLFTRKPVKAKPPVPAKPQNLVSTLTSNIETSNPGATSNASTNSDSTKKSCYFEIPNKPKPNSQSRTASVVRKFERNLQKFEKEKKAEQKARCGGMRSSVSSGALATHSCLKKVSKFDKANDNDDKNADSRRATSMRTKNRPKISVRFNTVSQIKYTPIDKRGNPSTVSTETSTTTICPLNDINRNETSSSSTLASDCGEKSFEFFVEGNGNENENMNVDSLKLYTKPELQALVDEIHNERASDTKEQKNKTNVVERSSSSSLQSSPTETSTTNQCINISKKIDVIEKLIEMEERKLEQIRLATESRMRPFECNSKQKGYVKSLTMNFDMLAKGIEKDIVNEQQRILADNSDTDLCAYARHIKRNVSLPDVLESTNCVRQPFHFFDKSGEVELAKEVKADSDTETEARDESNHNEGDGDNDETLKLSEHDSEKIRKDCCTRKDQGTPKTLNPMPPEESSIRRACSLSDLHMGNFGKSKSNSMLAQPKSGVVYRNSSASRSANKRNSLQLKGSTSNLGGSSNSMGLLNQGSDSETEDIGRSRSSGTTQNRTNGPIAGNRQHGGKSSNMNNRSRKVLASNFSNATPLQDDSSSEETPGGGSSGGKPTVPPRPRNLNFDHKSKIANNNPNASKRGSGNFENSPDSPNLEASDPKSQVHNVINKLYTTTKTVVQLHENLKNCEDSLMLKELENAVIMTQNMLTSITVNRNDKLNPQQQQQQQQQQQLNNNNNNNNNNNSSTTTLNVNSTNSEQQVTLENGDYMTVFNNCTDLLSNLRLKHKTDDCENNS